MCLVMLASDAMYFWAAAQGVGGWGEFLNVGVWEVDDWMVILGSLWPLGARLWIVFGV